MRPQGGLHVVRMRPCKMQANPPLYQVANTVLVESTAQIQEIRTSYFRRRIAVSQVVRSHCSRSSTVLNRYTPRGRRRAHCGAMRITEAFQSKASSGVRRRPFPTVFIRLMFMLIETGSIVSRPSPYGATIPLRQHGNQSGILSVCHLGRICDSVPDEWRIPKAAHSAALHIRRCTPLECAAPRRFL